MGSPFASSRWCEGMSGSSDFSVGFHRGVTGSAWSSNRPLLPHTVSAADGVGAEGLRAEMFGCWCQWRASRAGTRSNFPAERADDAQAVMPSLRSAPGRCALRRWFDRHARHRGGIVMAVGAGLLLYVDRQRFVVLRQFGSW